MGLAKCRHRGGGRIGLRATRAGGVAHAHAHDGAVSASALRDEDGNLKSMCTLGRETRCEQRAH